MKLFRLTVTENGQRIGDHELDDPFHTTTIRIGPRGWKQIKALLFGNGIEIIVHLSAGGGVTGKLMQALVRGDFDKADEAFYAERAAYRATHGNVADVCGETDGGTDG